MKAPDRVLVLRVEGTLSGPWVHELRVACEQARAEGGVEETAPVTAAAEAVPQAEAGAEMGEEEAVAAGAEMAAPVRFSSLFRSA